MEGVDNTLRFLDFQGVGSGDPKQHVFFYETIQAAKNVQDEVVKIAQLETMFRGRELVQYMKLQSTMPTRQAKTLTKIRKRIVERVEEAKFKIMIHYINEGY